MLRKKYQFYISQGGILCRESRNEFEVLMEGEWESPETSVGNMMPVSAEKVHALILKALKDYYLSDPKYRDDIWQGC